MSDSEVGLMKWYISFPGGLLADAGGFYVKFLKRHEEEGLGNRHFSPWEPRWGAW
jgi:hypothetical protein